MIKIFQIHLAPTYLGSVVGSQLKKTYLFFYKFADAALSTYSKNITMTQLGVDYDSLNIVLSSVQTCI